MVVRRISIFSSWFFCSEIGLALLFGKIFFFLIIKILSNTKFKYLKFKITWTLFSLILYSFQFNYFVLLLLEKGKYNFYKTDHFNLFSFTWLI